MIDTHTHIFFPEVLEGRDDFLDDVAFSLLYKSPSSRIVDRNVIDAYMKEQGIEKVFAYGFPWSDSGRCMTHNRYILENSDNRIVPFAVLPPAPSKGTDKLFSFIGDNHFTGIGELAFYGEDFTEDTFAYLRDICSLAREKNLILTLHMNEPVGHVYPGKYNTPFDRIYALILDFPDVDVILAHWGGGILFYEMMTEVKKAFSQVWYDTAASPFLYDNSVYDRGSDIADEKKILFGTDYPLLSPKRYLKEMDAAGVSPERQDRMLSLNAQDLLDKHR